MKRPYALLLVALAQCTGNDAHDQSAEPSTASEFGPALRVNPWAAAGAFATQHGDTGASDTSALPGPGTSPVEVARLDLLAVCPSILPRQNGKVLAVCVPVLTQIPTAFSFDPTTMTKLAERPLGKGSLFGGVYPYLDERDRLVVVDAENELLRLAGDDLHVEQQSALSLPDDHVLGLVPDFEGRDWFASELGVVGTVSRDGAVRTLPLGEPIANSIASAPSGVAVVSEQALYLLRADAQGTPSVVARVAYDRGNARKPGQLSWGSGSTPTFFGPYTGSDYVALTDNALPMNLIVVRNDGTPVCTLPVPGVEGTENSPIGAGSSVFVASTYGFGYPALPAGAGPSASAPFTGGMARIDVGADEQTCSVVWTNPVASTSVPKLSTADGLIYTLAQTDAGLAYTAIDADTGALASQQLLSGVSGPMQLAPTIAANGALFQGTLTSILRITATE